MPRSKRATSELLREELRKHYREAIAQEKGRFAAFDFPIPKGASEHLGPTAMEAEQQISAVDVIDIATLKRYQRQHEDLPSGLKEAILSLGGGLSFDHRRRQSTAKALSVQVQRTVQFPGGEKDSKGARIRKVPKGLQHTMLTTTCIRRVRPWGEFVPRDAPRPSGATEHAPAVLESTSGTPTTLPELATILRDPEWRL